MTHLLDENGSGRIMLDEIILAMAQQEYKKYDMSSFALTSGFISELALICVDNQKKFREFIDIYNVSDRDMHSLQLKIFEFNHARWLVEEDKDEQDTGSDS